MSRRHLARLAAIVAALCPSLALAQNTPSLKEVRTEVIAAGTPFPRFKVDTAWPQIPADSAFGQVSGVAIDAKDNIWITQRPNSLAENERAASLNPPLALCCKPLPPVMQFSPDGKVLAGWGGPASAPTIDGVNQWPANMHGMYVDAKNTLWFGGNGEGDHVIFNYTTDGKFIRAFGRKGQSRGNLDPAALGNPADVNDEGGEILIADGYVNERVIAFDDATSQFKWVLGAYGRQPVPPPASGPDMSRVTMVAAEGAASTAKAFANIVHCVVKTRDGDLYVCDRLNNRAQLFHETNGKLAYVRDIPIASTMGGQGTVSDIAFSPDQKYLYIADMSDGTIWILLRSTHQVLGRIGKIGRYAGEFTVLHNIATDSHGNLYATEVGNGQRIQKFVFDGVR